MVELIQGVVDTLYENFIEIVANGRSISIEEANLIAKGRVWSGIDALEVGLIDQIGSFHDAVEKAQNLAGIKSFYLKEYNQTKNNISFIMEFFNLFSSNDNFDIKDGFFANIKKEFAAIFKWSEKLNDRNQLYYICEECIINN